MNSLGTKYLESKVKGEMEGIQEEMKVANSCSTLQRVNHSRTKISLDSLVPELG